jgi:hypothetical protein
LRRVVRSSTPPTSSTTSASTRETSPRTSFVLTPNGLCTGNSRAATVAGAHTVTGTAVLTVTAGPLDHLVLSPATATHAAGSPHAYTAEGFDAFGNDRGDVTASTSFAIAPDGSCPGATCTPAAAGAHIVTGTDGTATGTATLTVTADTVTVLLHSHAHRANGTAHTSADATVTNAACPSAPASA